VTVTAGTRPVVVSTPGFPATVYLENTGVTPHFELEYMTEDNLRNGGRTYVNEVTRIAVEQALRPTAP
jgi:hypothetical protein